MDVLWFLLILTSCLPSFPASLVSLTSAGYRNILVDVEELPGNDPANCQPFRDALQNLLVETSSALCQATEGRAFFGEITVLLPDWCPSTSGAVYWARPRRADFVVGIQHPISGKNPIAFQYGGCGHPGLPVYIPHDFVLSNATKRGEQLVHEWSHYHYGVFDESGSTMVDPRFPIGYLVNGFLEPTACTNEALTGTWSDSNSSNCSSSSCSFDPSSENNGRIETSLMYRTDLPNMKKFCTKENHNMAAPNKQNFFCDARSSSEIIFSHSDFTNATKQRDSLCLPPNFKFAARPRVSYFVILDTSPAMLQGDRLKTAKESLAQFIWFLPEGTVDLLLFSDSITWVEKQLPLDVANKINLIRKIGEIQASTTGTAQGLHLALDEAAKVYNNTVDVILLTATPFQPRNYDTVVDNYRNKKMAVHALSIGMESFPALSNITFNGNLFMVPDWNPAAFRDSTRRPSTVAAGNLQNVYSQTTKTRVKIFETGLTVNPFSNTSGSFRVDTSGERLLIALTSSSLEAIITLSDDVGPYQIYTISDKIGLRIVDPIRSNPRAGQTITYTVSTLVNATDVNIDVWIENPDVANFVTVKTWSSSVENNPIDVTTNPVVLYAHLLQNKRPVIGARVTGVIHGMVKGSARELGRIPLEDSGFASDVTKGDGIYSGLVSNFSVDARNFAVIVEVSDNNGTAFIYSDYEQFDGSHATSGSEIPGRQSVLVSPFSRIVYGGADFSLKDPLPAGVDRLPPARITDLALSTYTVDTRRGSLMWTAPRDDYGAGLPVDDFVITQQIGVNDPVALEGSYNITDDQRVSFPFTVPLDLNGVTLVFRVQALDGRLNPSPLSNPVALVIPPLAAATTDVLLWALVGTGIGLAVIVILVLVYCGCCKDRDNRHWRERKTHQQRLPESRQETDDFNSIRSSVRATRKNQDQEEPRIGATLDGLRQFEIQWSREELQTAVPTFVNDAAGNLPVMDTASRHSLNSSRSYSSQRELAVYTVPAIFESYPARRIPQSEYANLPGLEPGHVISYDPTAPTLGKFKNPEVEPTSGYSTLRADSAAGKSWQDSNSFVYENPSGNPPEIGNYYPDPNEVGLPPANSVYNYRRHVPTDRRPVVARPAPPPPPPPPALKLYTTSDVRLRNGRESPESLESESVV